MIMNEKNEYNYTVSVYDSKMNNLALTFKDICINRRILTMYRNVFNTWLNQSKCDELHQLDAGYIQHSHEIIDRLRGNIKFRLEQLRDVQKRIVIVRFTEITRIDRKKRLTEFLNAWKDTCPTPRKPVREPINVSKNPYHIVTRITVKEDGTVGVKLSAPMAHIYEKYHKNFMIPPHEEYMKALLEFGYPQWAIDRSNKRYEKRGNREQPSCTLMEALDKYSKIKKPKAKVKSTLDKFKSSRS
jgi:hypothetical protein